MADQYHAALEQWHPKWLEDAENTDQIDGAWLIQEEQGNYYEEYEQYEDIPLNDMFLTEPSLQLTSSELQLSEGLQDDPAMSGVFSNEVEWFSFVKFVKRCRREILGKGYDSPAKCLACYRNYLEHKRSNPGTKFNLSKAAVLFITDDICTV